MSVTPTTELMYLKGVGPRRAEILAKRGLRTFEDLLGYLPFRYEDRIRFAKIREIAPGKVYTIRAQVLSGSSCAGGGTAGTDCRRTQAPRSAAWAAARPERGRP